jgi:hypothetical protein
MLPKRIVRLTQVMGGPLLLARRTFIRPASLSDWKTTAAVRYPLRWYRHTVIALIGTTGELTRSMSMHLKLKAAIQPLSVQDLPSLQRLQVEPKSALQ